MKTILIYRIEDRNLTGPFAGSNNVCDYHWDLFVHTNSLPLPRDDNFNTFDIYTDDSLVCGCNTLEQLKEWFPYEAIQLLDDLDYCLATYKVTLNNVEVGGSQVLFRNSASVCVSRVPVYELYQE